MNNKISLSNFDFKKTGYGHYQVTYTSFQTGKTHTKTTNNMPLIDATKNSDNPKIKDLNLLKKMCKSQ